ncbi:MAG: Nudix family hydrolase [Gammaproteobacteria bacterium]|nr:MAG: Nudix family hydrolase [Gammaproteobacteria bacterium]
MPNTVPEDVIQVAVGVVRDAEGRVLLAWRDSKRHQGGCWEFPGGKLEPGESVEAALARELHEELGIRTDPADMTPLIQIPWHYGDKSVLLNTLALNRFGGTPAGLEGQAVRWARIDDLTPDMFPAANRGILRSLQSPPCVFITPSLSDKEQVFRDLESAAERGAGMVILRPGAGQSPHADMLAQCAGHARGLGMRAMIHARCPRRCWALGDGLHLPAGQWMDACDRPAGWLGVSCHSPEELELARQAGGDYALLSPVCPTASHPGQDAIGWKTLAQWVRQAAMPVYALGGVGPADLPRAQAAGAQGVAGIRAFLSR